MPVFKVHRNSLQVTLEDRRPYGCIHAGGRHRQVFTVLNANDVREALEEKRLVVLPGQRLSFKRLREGETYHHGSFVEKEGKWVESDGI